MMTIDTLEKWQKHEAWVLAERKTWFDAYRLRGMCIVRGGRDAGRYQFGYEIGGYGTVVGPCCYHTHKTERAAEDCGQRFLAGKPPRWWWRLRRLTSVLNGG